MEMPCLFTMQLHSSRRRPRQLQRSQTRQARLVLKMVISLDMQKGEMAFGLEGFGSIGSKGHSRTSSLRAGNVT